MLSTRDAAGMELYHTLRIKPPVRTSEGYRVARRASMAFLNARINENYRILRKLDHDVYFQKCQLERILHHHHAKALESLRLAAENQETTKVKARQKRKFDYLTKNKSNAGLHAPSSERWVVNLSSRTLSPDQEKILSKGMNFALTPRRVPIPQIVATVESALQKTSCPQQSEEIRLKITRMLGRGSNIPSTNLTSRETRALKELREAQDILILPADKGRSTVVMNCDEYVQKLQNMLSDTNTYRKLNKDPSPALERKMNSKLLELRKKKEISEAIYKKVRSSAGKTPPLYGLPKIHKPSVPLRPIVSFINSPTYRLSKHLSGLLSPLVGKSPSAVRNSKDFADFITNQILEEGEILVSFDVVSLFTNIPTDMAIDSALRRLSVDDTLSDRTNLSVQSIISLLRLCLDATFFLFRGQYYQQIFGTAMGSPVSVTVANLVMEEIEERALATFDPPPRFWKRYVDDTCTALPTESVFFFHSNVT